MVSFALYFLAIFHFFPLKTIRKNIAGIQMFNIFKLDVLIASWNCISYIVRKLLVEMFVGDYDEKNWHADVF